MKHPPPPLIVSLVRFKQRFSLTQPFFCVVFVCFGIAATAQPGARVWEIAYGWPDENEEARKIIIRHDLSPEHFQVVGFTRLNGSNDHLIFELDDCGNVVCTTVNGGTGDDKGMSLVQRQQNSNIYVTGYENSLSPPAGLDTYTYYFNENNCTVSQPTTGVVGGSETEVARDIVLDEANPVEIAVAGFTNTDQFLHTQNGTVNDAYLVKYAGANLAGTRTYGMEYVDRAEALVSTGLGNTYVLAGMAEFPSGQLNGYILEVNQANNLNPIWQTRYRDDLTMGKIVFYDIVENPYANGYVVTGRIENGLSGSSGFDIIVMSVDNSGNPIWMRAYGGDQPEEGFEVIPTTLHDNSLGPGFTIIGYSMSFSANIPPDEDLIALSIDQNGALMLNNSGQSLSYIYGGRYDDRGYSIKQLSASGPLVMAGWTESYSANPGMERDAYVLCASKDFQIDVCPPQRIDPEDRILTPNASTHGRDHEGGALYRGEDDENPTINELPECPCFIK